METLTPRQERFCHTFVYCLNAAKAARDAGYAPRTANQQGYRLLKDPRIEARIQRIQWALAERHGRDTDTLVGKLEMVYRRAMEDGRYHAAVRAVALQSQLANPGAGPQRLWREIAEASVKSLQAVERKAAQAESRSEAPAAAEPASEAAARPEPPAAAETRLRAVGG